MYFFLSSNDANFYCCCSVAPQCKPIYDLLLVQKIKSNDRFSLATHSILQEHFTQTRDLVLQIYGFHTHNTVLGTSPFNLIWRDTRLRYQSVLWSLWEQVSPPCHHFKRWQLADKLINLLLWAFRSCAEGCSQKIIYWYPRDYTWSSHMSILTKKGVL